MTGHSLSWPSKYHVSVLAICQEFPCMGHGGDWHMQKITLVS